MLQNCLQTLTGCKDPRKRWRKRERASFGFQISELLWGPGFQFPWLWRKGSPISETRARASWAWQSSVTVNNWWQGREACSHHTPGCPEEGSLSCPSNNILHKRYKICICNLYKYHLLAFYLFKYISIYSMDIMLLGIYILHNHAYHITSILMLLDILCLCVRYIL